MACSASVDMAKRSSKELVHLVFFIFTYQLFCCVHSLFSASFLFVFENTACSKACPKLGDRHKQPETRNLSDKRDRERKQHIQLMAVRHILKVNIKCSGRLMRDSTQLLRGGDEEYMCRCWRDEQIPEKMNKQREKESGVCSNQEKAVTSYSTVLTLRNQGRSVLEEGLDCCNRELRIYPLSLHEVREVFTKGSDLVRFF